MVFHCAPQRQIRQELSELIHVFLLFNMSGITESILDLLNGQIQVVIKSLITLDGILMLCSQKSFDSSCLRTGDSIMF